MYLNVKERGDHVATFRWIEARFMEMLAAWVPTTPEMEVKLVFGAHIWDLAQHADSFGKRTHELRLPLQHSLEPTVEYVQFIDDIASATETSKRVAGFYDCALPGLERRLKEYVQRVDDLLDGPTVRIIERVLFDVSRITADSIGLRDEVPVVRLGDQAWLDVMRRREGSVTTIVGAQDPRVALSEARASA